jgi:fructokinase
MDQRQLFPLIHNQVYTMLNGYIQSPQIIEQMDHYIVPPALGGRAGVLGAIALAEVAASGVNGSDQPG